MPFTDEQKTLMREKLDQKHVKPPAPGRFGDYIEGWHAIAEANRIFGEDGWTRETIDVKPVMEATRKISRSKWVDGKKTFEDVDGFNVSYIAKVRVCAGGIVREGTGAGHGIDLNLGLAHESAIKEAETDAMKRALMTFGNPFGLALYDKTKENVEDKEAVNAATALDAYLEEMVQLGILSGLTGFVKGRLRKLPKDIQKDAWEKTLDYAKKRFDAVPVYDDKKKFQEFVADEIPKFNANQGKEN